ncbi:MAG: beta-ketoacyl synthase N-terminal-like domain-containing protein [Myxococcota bacterium]|nr:beta-ketoacyl synthase N-terminal-like domain-containing protein [Myxococcota bacterium]
MTVAITGVGLLCPAGLAPQPAFQAMLAGGPRPAAPTLDFDPSATLGARGIRHFDRTALLLACAATAAIDSSKLLEGAYAPEDIGIVVGETHGSIQSITDFDQEALREGPRYVNPQAFCNTVINAPAGRLAIRFGITGLNSTLSTGATSGLDAIGHAWALVQGGEIKAAICGAALGYSSEVELGYRRSGLLGDPSLAEAPFSVKRRGAVLGEGAALMVLEDADAAAERGVPALATLRGAGSAFEPRGAGAGDARPASNDGLLRAMRGALAQGGVGPEDLSLVSSGASGSVEGDALEAVALRELLGEASGRVAVTAPKSVCFESFEASGAIGLVAAVSAIQAGRIPPVAGLTEVDPCAEGLDLVLGSAREQRVDHVLVTSSEEAGHRAAVLVSRA